MKVRSGLIGCAAVVMAAGCGGVQAHAETVLNVFIGGQQRPAVMRKLFAMYHQKHPDVIAKVQVGGATSAQQQQYLSTVLAGHSSKLDVMLIDVTRPSQYGAAGWSAPLNRYLGGHGNKILRNYLSAYAKADTYKGKVVALPAFADSMFLYYRKDLLAKYGLKPPKTWDQLVKEAKEITTKQKNPNLQGFNFQGAPIEGTVCTFLVPFWDAGGHVIHNNKVDIKSPAGRKALSFLKNTIYKYRVAPPNTSQVATDDTRKTFQDGNAVFAINWAYAWNWFQKPQSHVKGEVGVERIPTFGAHSHSTCLGGWQWAVSAYSNHKEAAAKLVQFLSSKEASRFLAIHASNLPVYASVYKDPEVEKVDPWFASALPVVESARSRPTTPAYSEVSDVIRSNVNAVLAGQESVNSALSSMQRKLSNVLLSK